TRVAQAGKLACYRYTTPHPERVAGGGVEPPILGYEPSVCMLLPSGAGLVAGPAPPAGLFGSPDGREKDPRTSHGSGKTFKRDYQFRHRALRPWRDSNPHILADT